MRMTTLALPLLLLTGCATTDSPPPKLTEKQMERLQKELAGKEPGEKVACVTRLRSFDSLQAISDEVLLYRQSSKLIYKNELIGRCSGISRGDTLVLRTFGSQYCRGDMAYAVDLVTGMQRGACALGDFIPYRTPKK